MTRRPAAALGCAGLLTLCAARADAEPAIFDYAVSAGLAYSDNVGLTAANAVASTSAVAGLQLDAKRATGRLHYLAAGDLSYYDYFVKSIHSQLFGQVNGSGTYDIVPGSFQWMAAGSYGQVRQDLARAAAPGNLENLLSLTTGPSIKARFGHALEATLDARVARQAYSKLGNDNNTVGLQLVLDHRPSANTLFGIGASFDDVTYPRRAGVAAVDYKRREAFVRYDASAIRTHISADVGYAKITGGRSSSSGPLFRVRATRRLTPSLSAFIAYEQQYPTSQTQALAPLPGAGVGGIDGAALTAAPRLSKNASAGLIFARPRTSFDLTYSHLNESAQLGVPGQRTYDLTGARVSRALSPRSSASIYATYAAENLPFLSLKNQEKSVGGQLSFGWGKSLSVDLRLGYSDRHSSIPLNGYSEFNGGVFLRYGRVQQPFAGR